MARRAVAVWTAAIVLTALAAHSYFARPRNGTAPPPLVQGSGASRARQAYKLIDAATSQQLYLREWVLWAAPLSQPDDPSQRFYLLPVC